MKQKKYKYYGIYESILFFKRMKAWLLEAVKYRVYDKILKKKVIKYDMKLYKILVIRGSKKKWYLKFNYIYSYEQINFLRKVFKKKTMFYKKKQKKKQKKKIWFLNQYRSDYYDENIQYFYITNTKYTDLEMKLIYYNQFFNLMDFNLITINLDIKNNDTNLNELIYSKNANKITKTYYNSKKQYYKLKNSFKKKLRQTLKKKLIIGFCKENHIVPKEIINLHKIFKINRINKLKIFFNKYNIQNNKIMIYKNILNNKYFQIFYTYKTYEKLFCSFFYKRLKNLKEFVYFYRNNINTNKYNLIRDYWILPTIKLNYNEYEDDNKIENETDDETDDETDNEDYNNYKNNYNSDYDNDHDHEEESNKITFFNFFSKKVKTYKNARLVHWNLKQEEKLIKEKRYRKFLNKSVKKKLKIKNSYISNINIYYFLNLNLNLPWKFSILFFNKIFNIFNINNIKKNNIYRLPINIRFNKIILFLNKKNKKNDRKVKNWSYLNFLKIEQFWKTKKKALPKFVKRHKIFLKKFNNILQFDKITKSFIILKETYKNINIMTEILEFNNKLYKITNFKYRS